MLSRRTRVSFNFVKFLSSNERIFLPGVVETDDLLSKAINSTISSPLLVEAEDVERKDCKKVVLSDRTGDGKVGKHAVRMRVRENVKYYICNFCPR